MKNSGELTMLQKSPDQQAAECVEAQSTNHTSEARLQDLIPIAMVIVGGCEPCAESMVNRALKQGSSWQDIDKALTHRRSYTSTGLLCEGRRTRCDCPDGNASTSWKTGLGACITSQMITTKSFVSQLTRR
jgi:alkylhydroperoxidase/carboxymuconolactone decarboxylase family protein YurZ